MKTTFDVIIIGGGPAGYIAAIRASQLGLDTALIESKHLGGVCLNYGCIPTKTLMHSANVLRLCKKASNFGVNVGYVKPDLAAMVKRSRSIVMQLQKGISDLLSKNKIKVFKGYGYLNKVKQVMVENDRKTIILNGCNIILATGGRTRLLPDIKPDGKYIWTYSHALTSQQIPKRLVIIGGGAIGVEFASFYQTLGSQVSVIEITERILPSEDEEISTYITKSLIQDGVKFYTGSFLDGYHESGGVIEALLNGHSHHSLQADAILIATGITGNYEQLGLKNTCVKVNNGHVIVDEFCRTDESGIYAIGDLAGAPWLAHKASHEAIICVEKIAGLHPRPLDLQLIPSCVYSHPQIASVGYTEAKARASGFKVRIGRFPFMANGKAVATDATGGFVKVIFNELTGELLGAHMVGEGVTEMIQGYTIARSLEITEEDFNSVIFPHPTMSETMFEAVMSAHKGALHM